MIWITVKIMHISTNYIPLWTVFFQYLAIIFFIFYKSHMNKTSHRKT